MSASMLILPIVKFFTALHTVVLRIPSQSGLLCVFDSGLSEAALQSMMTSKEMKALDEEIIANAINAKKAALKRNQDAYDLAKLSRHTHSKKK